MMTVLPVTSEDWIDFWENEMPQTLQRQMHITELENSIIELSKRKLKLLQEVNDINETISFLRQQQDSLGEM